MVNAYVTWVKEMEDLGVRVGTHLGFKIVVGRHLIEDVFNNCAPPRKTTRTSTRVASTYSHTLPIIAEEEVFGLRSPSAMVLPGVWTQMDVPQALLL